MKNSPFPGSPFSVLRSSFFIVASSPPRGERRRRRRRQPDVVEEDGFARPPAPGSAERLSEQVAVVEFLNGSLKERQWRLDRALTLFGRTQVCPLQLVHASVSKVHGCLLTAAGGVWLIDLLGRGGVKVNGRP